MVATNEPPTKLPLEPKTMSLGFTKNTLAVSLVRIKPSILEILLPVTRVKMLLKTSQASIRLQIFYYLAINLIKFHSQTQIFRKNLKILQTFTNTNATYPTSPAPHTHKRYPTAETSPTISRSQSAKPDRHSSTRAKSQTPDSAPNSPLC